MTKLKQEMTKLNEKKAVMSAMSEVAGILKSSRLGAFLFIGNGYVLTEQEKMLLDKYAPILEMVRTRQHSVEGGPARLSFFCFLLSLWERVAYVHAQRRAVVGK